MNKKKNNKMEPPLQITKEEFIDLVKGNPMKTLDMELRSQVAEDRDSQRKLSKVIMPDFKDEMDINKCMESDWFFS